MTEETKPTILDAVNAALDPLIEKPAETPEPDETPEPESPESETPESGAAGDVEGEQPPEDETPEQKTAREAAAATTKAPEGETPEEKTAREAAANAAKKPLDPVNDPIPATVAERTRERMTSLIGMVKELTPVKAQFDELITTITSTGASADEFSTMLGYMRAVHSNNIEDRRQAYQLILSELRGLAPLIGEVIPGEDPLAGHQDLANAVAAQSLSQEHATEIAKARNSSKATTTAVQAQTTTQQAAQAFETARLAGVADLNTLEVTLKASDPEYARKREILVQALEPSFKQLHPSLWKTTFENAYKNLKVAAAPRAIVPSIKPGQQPMRANKTPAGEGAKKPSTMLEAMTASLEQLKA
jgi:hypothetical protein